MSTIRFTEDHEWIRLEGDGTATVGITDHAQDALGDLVYVELPDVGASFSKGDAACVIESVKAAADVKMPVDAEVVAVNEALPEEPAKVNQDPMGEGWFVKVKVSNPGQLDALMDEAAYQAFLGK